MGPSVHSQTMDTTKEMTDFSNNIETININSFLNVKKKMIQTQELLERYEHTKQSLVNLKAELKHKQSQLTDLNKDYKELKDTNNILRNKVKENETQMNADQHFIHQLKCKINETDTKYKEKVDNLESSNAALQSNVRRLTQEIRTLEKTKNIVKPSPKPRKGTKLPSPFKSTRDIGIILPETTTSNTRSIAVGPSESSIIEESSIITPVERVKNNLFIQHNKNTMTDEFYSINNDPYPLFCGKCQVSLDKPAERIIKEMTSLPLPLSPLPTTPRRRAAHPLASQTSQSDSQVTMRLQNIEQTLGKLLKTKKKRGKDLEPLHCSRTLSSHCCGHNPPAAPVEHNVAQVEMLTALVSKMMQLNEKKPTKRRRSVEIIRKTRMKHKMKRVKKVNFERHWEVQSDTTVNDQEPEAPLSSLPIPTLEIPSERIYNNEIPTVQLESSKLCEREFNEQPNNHVNQSIINETNMVSSVSRMPVDVAITRKRKRDDAQKQARTKAKDILTRIKKMKKDKTAVVPLHVLKPTPKVNSQDKPETESLVPCQKKRIAHISKSHVDEIQKEPEPDITPVTKRGRVTRSMIKSQDHVAAAVVPLTSPTVDRRKKKSTVLTDSTVESTVSAIESQEIVRKSPVKRPVTPVKLEDRNEAPEEKKIGRSYDNESIRKESFTTKDNLKSESTENVSTVLAIPQIDSATMETHPDESGNVGEDGELVNDNSKQLEIDSKDDEEVSNSLDEILKLPLGDELTPASPDPCEPTCEEIHVPELLPVASIYDSAMIDESSTATEPLTSSSVEISAQSQSNTPQASNNQVANNVRELRNRKVQISPPKASELKLLNTTQKTVPAIHESILSYLNRHLELKKLKKAPRIGKYQQEASVKLYKRAQETIASELKRLVDNTDWDLSVHESVVENLKQIPSELAIAKGVVNLIVELVNDNEPTDMTFTPPAPIMTKSQQKIIAMLQSLEKHKTNVINHTLTIINNELMRPNAEITFDAAEALGRMFVCLAKLKKDRERVRIFVCDALYSLQRKALIILHAVISNWSEVLPIYNENQQSYLPNCIVHVIRAHKIQTSVRENSKIGQLKRLLKGHYHYPDDQPLSTTHINKLLTALVEEKHDRSIITAIILIAKKEGCDWTYKHIINGGLLKIIVDNKNSSCIYDALRLLGFLLRVFPIADENGHVLKIIQQLCAILNDGTSSSSVQEGVVSALLSLSRHRFVDVANAVLIWRPTRSLPMELLTQLTSFFNSRSEDSWYKVKCKLKNTVKLSK